MTPEQLRVVVRAMRLPDASAAAARAVLVDGQRPADVARACGLKQTSVSRTIKRVLRTYDEIAAAGPWPPREAADSSLSLPPLR
ncbi:MAG: hypothetical protein J0H00_07425 [Burkholderiales bacterium]|nr:hypothetical protein [Burkholderiales bacterium]